MGESERAKGCGIDGRGNMKRKIFLFPNTGHHYYFMPLELEVGIAQDAIRKFQTVENVELPKLKTAGAIEKKAAEDPRWRKAAAYSWLRWQFGERQYIGQQGGIRAFGIWLAVETNLGNRTRGYVWDIERHPRQDDPGWTAYRERSTQGEDETSPYYRDNAGRLPQDEIIDLAVALGLQSYLADKVELKLEIVWPDPVGNVIPVHLAIDFGNSRTIALALEERPAAANESLRNICWPIQFGATLEDAGSIEYNELAVADEPPPGDNVAESWFVLREPRFSDKPFEVEQVTMDEFMVVEHITPKQGRFGTASSQLLLHSIRRRVPQMFVELSPAVIGPEASKGLLAGNLAMGGRFFLSSPKRYAWDTDPVGGGGEAVWTMLPSGAHTTSRHLLPKKLAGEMLGFLPERHARRVVDDPTEYPPPVEWEELEERPVRKPYNPNFSRADSLIWTALSILEHANRQINAESFRKNNQPNIPRRLASVTVTRPAGWTQGEIRAYWAAWREAKNIFFWSREPYWTREPPYLEWEGPPYLEVDMLLDEGIASQLAIVYSEIRHFGGRGRDWISLFGRRRGDDELDSIRVMTIDIGGGSTDVSVVEYHDEQREGIGSELKPQVLMTDSSAFAGDRLVLEIIERVLLPTIGLRFKDNPRLKAQFADALLYNDGMDKLLLSLITRTVFMPMVQRWFEDFEAVRHGNAAEHQNWTPLQCGCDLTRIAEFNRRMENAGLGAGLLQPNASFQADYPAIDAVIKDWAREIADRNAYVFAAFQCDLVIVTGKPSELPQTKEVLKERLPVELHRLLFAHNYFAGEWFPCAGPDSLIPDAKMVTVAGAALYTAVTCDVRRRDSGYGPLLRNFRMVDITARKEPSRNLWGRIGAERLTLVEDEVLLDVRQERSAVVELDDYAAIGRARFPGVEFEPIYQFRIYDRDIGAGERVQLVLRRKERNEDGTPLPSEELIIESARRRDGSSVDCELKLRTLPAKEEHWLDRGTFEVRW